jgi:hypothetical protein
MKILSVLLLFASSPVFAQSGYYYFASSGEMEEGQRGMQIYVSYEFYAQSKPACTQIYAFLDLNYPLFDYILRNGSGCDLKGPFATQEEAKKARDRHADRLRNGTNTRRRVTNIIYEERKSPSSKNSG